MDAQARQEVWGPKRVNPSAVTMMGRLLTSESRIGGRRHVRFRQDCWQRDGMCRKMLVNKNNRAEGESNGHHQGK